MQVDLYNDRKTVVGWLVVLNYRFYQHRVSFVLQRCRDYRNIQHTDVDVIDFGSATFDDESHSSVIGTRQYRAPEIVLGRC